MLGDGEHLGYQSCISFLEQNYCQVSSFIWRENGEFYGRDCIGLLPDPLNKKRKVADFTNPSSPGH